MALPVVRGLVPLAKAIAAIDCLSGGRVVVGVGPGSAARDHQVVGLEFDEPWKRLEEAVHAFAGAVERRPRPFIGRFYPTEGVDLAPTPIQHGALPI